MKPDPRDSHLTVAIKWLGPRGAVVSTDTRPVRLSAANGWQRISFSIDSPAGATGARLIVTGRRVLIDDVDFRMDGPYLRPWMTPGWYGRELDLDPEHPGTSGEPGIEGWEIDPGS